MFYPQIKKHLSPSAFQAWHNNRSLFIRSYFMGEKSPETSSMKAGTAIHSLIENGLYPAQKRFDRNEHEVVIEVKDGVLALGKPDSYGTHAINGVIELVDYKTGKEDLWTNEKVAIDLKCKMTAWLVLMQHRKEGYTPTAVKHYLEYIPTFWNEEAHEIQPVPDVSSTVYEATYTAEELDEFTKVIEATIDEVNAEYPAFMASTDEFVNRDDVLELADINSQIVELEAKADIIKERLGEQLKMGNRKNFESVVGTVYITEKKTYEYPEDLLCKTEGGEEFTLADFETYSVGAKVAKKNYELSNEPKTVSQTVAFRAKKKK